MKCRSIDVKGPSMDAKGPSMDAKGPSMDAKGRVYRCESPSSMPGFILYPTIDGKSTSM